MALLCDEEILLRVENIFNPWWPLPLATTGFVFVVYYLLSAVKFPVLVVRPGPFQHFLEKRIPILQQRHWPPIWCLEARAQMILSTVLRFRYPMVNYTRELFTFSDGGNIALHWLHVLANPSAVVIIIPGVSGDAHTDYARALAISVTKQGATAVVANHRGRAGLKLNKPWTICSTNTIDLEEIIDEMKHRFPDTPLMAVGVSLGGIILGQYLIKHEATAAMKISAAVLLSSGFDITKGVANMEESSLNRALNRLLTAKLCADVNRSREVFETGSWDVDKILQSQNSREFDNQLTAPLYGFHDAAHYYEAASMLEGLTKIRVPTVTLNAADDPFQPLDSIPKDWARKSSHVAMILTSRGGHVAFLEGWKPQTIHFAERLVAQLVHAIVHHGHELHEGSSEDKNNLSIVPVIVQNGQEVSSEEKNELSLIPVIVHHGHEVCEERSEEKNELSVVSAIVHRGHEDSSKEENKVSLVPTIVHQVQEDPCKEVNELTTMISDLQKNEDENSAINMNKRLELLHGSTAAYCRIRVSDIRNKFRDNDLF